MGRDGFTSPESTISDFISPATTGYFSVGINDVVKLGDEFFCSAYIIPGTSFPNNFPVASVLRWDGSAWHTYLLETPDSAHSSFPQATSGYGRLATDGTSVYFAYLQLDGSAGPALGPTNKPFDLVVRKYNSGTDSWDILGTMLHSSYNSDWANRSLDSSRTRSIFDICASDTEVGAVYIAFGEYGFDTNVAHTLITGWRSDYRMQGFGTSSLAETTVLGANIPIPVSGTTVVNDAWPVDSAFYGLRLTNGYFFNDGGDGPKAIIMKAQLSIDDSGNGGFTAQNPREMHIIGPTGVIYTFDDTDVYPYLGAGVPSSVASRGRAIVSPPYIEEGTSRQMRRIYSTYTFFPTEAVGAQYIRINQLPYDFSGPFEWFDGDITKSIADGHMGEETLLTEVLDEPGRNIWMIQEGDGAQFYGQRLWQYDRRCEDDWFWISDQWRSPAFSPTITWDWIPSGSRIIIEGDTMYFLRLYSGGYDIASVDICRDCIPCPTTGPYHLEGPQELFVFV